MMVLTNFSSHDFLLKDVNSANHLEEDDAKLKEIVKNTNYFSEKSELESSFVKSTPIFEDLKKKISQVDDADQIMRLRTH